MSRSDAQKRADKRLASKRVTWSVAYNKETHPELAAKLAHLKTKGDLHALFSAWLHSM